MRAGIALGSNIEPRLVHLQTARRRIFELNSGFEPVIVSKVYETAPVGCAEGTQSFLNAVLEFSTDLEPEALFDRLQRIEQEMGRPQNHATNSPRSIDLDILYCDNITLNTEKLILPHPRLAARRFVLQPLCDIRPDLVLPNFTENIEQLLNSLRDQDNVLFYCNSIY